MSQRTSQVNGDRLHVRIRPPSIPSCRYANAPDGAAVGVSRRLTALYVYPGPRAHEGRRESNRRPVAVGTTARGTP